jgi:hypothetical protein
VRLSWPVPRAKGVDHAGDGGVVSVGHGQGVDVSAEGQRGHIDVTQPNSTEVGQARDRGDSEAGPDEAAHDVVVVAPIPDAGAKPRAAVSLEG